MQSPAALISRPAAVLAGRLPPAAKGRERVVFTPTPSEWDAAFSAL